MLRHLTVLLLVCAVAAVASAQTATKTAQQGNPTTQTFIDLENKWNDALVKADTVALAAILADGYVSTDEQGHQRDKLGILARLKSGERKYRSLKLSDVRLHLYGDAAVVTGINTGTGTSDGQPLPARIAWTDTFIRQNGAWRAVATHASEVR